MPYRVAGIDVHKRKLAVVVTDVEEDEYRFERRWYGSNPEQLRVLSEWLIEQQVEEVVMESTAQYWKPVWEALERFWKAKCQSREGASRMSNCPVWFRICWVPVHVVCPGRLRMEEVILRLWPPWPIIACAPPRRNCMTLWVPARRSTRSIAGWSS